MMICLTTLDRSYFYISVICCLIRDAVFGDFDAVFADKEIDIRVFGPLDEVLMHEGRTVLRAIPLFPGSSRSPKWWSLAV